MKLERSFYFHIFFYLSPWSRFPLAFSIRKLPWKAMVVGSGKGKLGMEQNVPKTNIKEMEDKTI